MGECTLPKDKIIAAHQVLDSFRATFDGLGIDGIDWATREIDALERFVAVQFPRLPIHSEAAPIEQAKRDIARLLDLRQQNSFSQGVHCSSWHKDAIPAPRGKAVQT